MWIYTICPGLSVQKLRIIMVNFCYFGGGNRFGKVAGEEMQARVFHYISKPFCFVFQKTCKFCSVLLCFGQTPLLLSY